MDRVYAQSEGGLAEYLGTEDQMDEMLKKGTDLYILHDDGSTELLATPKDGYLLPKPQLTITMVIGGNNNG